ncbi:helix-turn-helix domain-containing protein [Streptomyces caniscabiei]|uniref:Transcriptional regulator n=1 Tax=Streptomyces caniscabiei TaxID=2746961 RepID=A0A927QJ18_9ACTN|nr:helix-turn-helix domain-containing protein [Streptomyces caniscabiei]MBD9723492.1 transcriptional regulator [Streptomyces caniscabiei]MDX3516214.1 helix-turn-helix domain-containing protein [Streptomyces caniscabiei]MDX3725274.1 helix-turn-helix domain-containing protein [Streptomyces caniscabiei]WEO27062.1 helix-turn-helix domain-containing protein [Streptomyces caniscabiei]
MRDYTTGLILTGNARQTTAQQAADLYAQGCTIRSVARQIGRSYGGTRVLLLEAGVRLRGRGGNTRKAAA